MSYLLDALKKANGEEPVNTPTMQATSPMPQPQSRSNGYQWLSVVLAILLALTIGYLLGTKWSWVEQQIVVQPTVLATPSGANTMQATSASTATSVKTPLETPAAISQPIEQQVSSELAKQSPSLATMTNEAPSEAAANPIEEAEPHKSLIVSKAKGSDEIVVEEEKPLLQEDEVMLGYVPEDARKESDPTQAMELEEVSPQLLAQFRMAVEESTEQTADEHPVFETDVVAIHELSKSLQARIPAMSFTTHIYATDPSERWVKINGKTIKERQWLSSFLQLVEIKPQYVVMSVDGRKFTLAALTDWDGVETNP